MKKRKNIEKERHNKFQLQNNKKREEHVKENIKENIEKERHDK